MRMIIILLVLVLSAAAAAFLGAQSSPDGRLEVGPGPDGTLEVRIRGGDRLVSVAGVPSDTTVQVRWTLNGRFVALGIPRSKYTDLLLYEFSFEKRGQVDAASVRELMLPVLPAAGILERFPSAGKPPGADKLRLVSMSVAAMEWRGDTLFLVAHLGCVQDPTGELWRYVVDYSYSMPAPLAMDPPRLTVSNVVLERASAPAPAGR